MYRSQRQLTSIQIGDEVKGTMDLKQQNNNNLSMSEIETPQEKEHTIQTKCKVVGDQESGKERNIRDLTVSPCPGDTVDQPILLSGSLIWDEATSSTRTCNGPHKVHSLNINRVIRYTGGPGSRCSEV